MSGTDNGRLWFKAKRYGWGWTPSSPQGWGVIIAFVLIIMGPGLLNQTPGLAGPLWAHLLWVGFWTAALVAICYAKGERPRWRWGGN